MEIPKKDNSTPMSREISAQRKENRKYKRSSRDQAYQEVKPTKRTTSTGYMPSRTTEQQMKSEAQRVKKESKYKEGGFGDLKKGGVDKKLKGELKQSMSKLAKE